MISRPWSSKEERLHTGSDRYIRIKGPSSVGDWTKLKGVDELKRIGDLLMRFLTPNLAITLTGNTTADNA